MAEHITRAFDDSLAEINNMVLSMGGLALSQFHGVIDAIDIDDTTVLQNLIAADAKIDEIEETLNTKAIETIAKWSPFAEDLRKVVVAIKMAHILERIGDYAANIAKRNIRICEEGVSEDFATELKEAGNVARTMLVDVLDAYRHLDEEKALSVWNRDITLDKMHNDINRTIIVAMEKGELSAASGSNYLFILKNIERIGDFATGISEQIYFLINARQIEDERPKA